LSRVVLDTGVLIEVLRDAEAADTVIRRRWRILLSAVVHSELVRGADTKVERAYVAQLARHHPPVAPTERQWERCGIVLARLRREQGYDPAGIRGIQNDVLVALLARDHGVPVVTTDRTDFERIAALVLGVSVLPWTRRP
jgi:predicted nucleic acid-binding protein